MILIALLRLFPEDAVDKAVDKAVEGALQNGIQEIPAWNATNTNRLQSLSVDHWLLV